MPLTSVSRVAVGFVVALVIAIPIAVFVNLQAAAYVVGGFVVGALLWIFRAFLTGGLEAAGADVYGKLRTNPFELLLDAREPIAIRHALGGERIYDVGVEAPDREALEHVDANKFGDGYVPRDIDEVLDSALRRDDSVDPDDLRVRLVVVEGVAKSGKSRALLEAIRRTDSLQDWLLIRPANPLALRQLSETKPKKLKDQPCLIWLDDLEDWITDASARFRASDLENLHKWGDVLVAATLGGRGLKRIRAANSDPESLALATDPVDHFLSGASITANTKICALERNFTDAEMQSAVSNFGPESERLITEAGGIGPYMIGGKRLLRQLSDSKNTNPIHHAVVAAVIHWRRSGIVRGLPQEAIEKLNRTLLSPPVPPTSDITEALRWACRTHSETPLIYPDQAENESSYRPVDYLAANAVIDPPPDDLVLGFLEYVRSEECAVFGAVYWETQRSDLAKLAWEKGFRSGDMHSSHNLGVLFHVQGKPKEAKKAFRQGMKLGHSLSANNLGVLLHEEGNSEEAEDAWRQGMELGGGDSAFNIGVSLYEKGNSEEAKDAWRRGIEFGDGNSAYNLGHLLYEEDESEGAEDAWRRGMELGNAKAAFDLGILFKDQGRTKEAKDAWQRGMELGHDVAAFNLGVLLAKKGNREAAMDVWRRAMELGSGKAAHNLGIFLYEDSNSEEAMDAFRQGMELKHGESAFALSKLLLAEDDVQSSIEAAERGDELGNAECAYALGLVYRDTGRHDLADECIARARARGFEPEDSPD